jgi:hypothetical protein
MVLWLGIEPSMRGVAAVAIRQWPGRRARAAHALRRSILSSMEWAGYLPEAPPIGPDATSRQFAARKHVAAQVVARVGR